MQPLRYGLRPPPACRSGRLLAPTPRKEASMRFYTQQHRHYCGIDLHARSLYLCVLDRSGKTVAHQKLACDRDELLRVLKPYRKDLVVAVECLFCWYWVADLCKEEGIEFVLGHALEMKAIHGGKTKNDRID